MTDVQWCQETLLAALTKQTDRRGEYDDLQWIRAELEVVADAANRWCRNHGIDRTYAWRDIEQIERPALGHVDWARKLCLYVAEHIYSLD